MAQLKDSIVSGNLRVTDTTLTDTLHVTTIKAPTSSGGTTYGPGTSGQVLKSNGTMTYWADMPTIPSNNVTGSGTSGYLTKWNGTNTITNGPQLGSSTTTFLRNDGTWATPANTDTKVTQSQTTTTNYRPILFGAKNSTDVSTLADTITDQAYTSTKMFAKPDTGFLYASGFSTSGYTNGTGAQLVQYGLYLKSYKSASLPAGGDYSYSRYAIRTYDGKAGDNSGMLLEMGGGGLTIVGAGESASSLAALISDDQRDSNTSRTRLDVGGTLNTSFNGSSEQLILSSDNNIYFLTACNTITGRKPVCLDTSSYFYPGTNKTGSIGTSSYMWNSVYAATIYENGTSLASKYAPIGPYIPMSGSTGVTGNIKITKASGETGFYAKRSDTDVEVLMGVGTGGTNHGIYSVKLTDWIVCGDAEKVSIRSTLYNPSSAADLYAIPLLGATPSTGLKAVYNTNGFRYTLQEGTANEVGTARMVLGNGIASGNAGNKRGSIRLYSASSSYVDLIPASTTTAKTLTLPAATGTVKLEKRSMMYDDTSDWASYSWHKFAEITSSTNYDDKAITFLVSRTYDTDYSGILSVHVRMNGSKNYQKHQFKWLIADENINPNNFVLVYTNNGTTSCKIELWYKQSQIYEGWIFEVLKEHTRMASENAWTVYTTSGHGSATYTAGTNHHASELACVQSKTALYTVKGTHTTTTNAWTGKIDATALYDGMTIAYYLPYAVSPSANVTLNLTLSDGTTTGAINCYQNNTTRITTHYGAGSTIILTYWSAGSISVAGTATTDNRWTRCDYNSNNSVTQNNTTTDASYRVIFSGNANDKNETTTVRKNANLQFNPNTATLSIGKAGTTQGSIVFNNSEGGHATLKSNSKGTSPTFLLPDTGSNGEHTLSTGMYDLSVTKGLMKVTNVANIPAHTMAFKIVFKSDASTPIYSMVEIPDLGNGIDYGGLIQVGDYSDGQGSVRIIMKAVIIRITAGSITGTRTFTATVSSTQQISGTSVSGFTRNVSIEKIYACT